MKTPSFKITKGDADTVSKIVDRALSVARKHRVHYDRMDATMDITACHNDHPLDLERLLSFPDFDFAHDVFGIRKHLNRDTGELEGLFSPRCSKRS